MEDPQTTLEKMGTFINVVSGIEKLPSYVKKQEFVKSALKALNYDPKAYLVEEVTQTPDVPVKTTKPVSAGIQTQGLEQQIQADLNTLAAQQGAKPSDIMAGLAQTQNKTGIWHR
jgi:hypothetical protein